MHPWSTAPSRQIFAKMMTYLLPEFVPGLLYTLHGCDQVPPPSYLKTELRVSHFNPISAAFSLTTFTRLFHIFVPQFLHLENGENDLNLIELGTRIK